MTKSPFIRIREKNTQIKQLTESFNDIATVLSCEANLPDILASILEANEWKGSYMKAVSENDTLRVNMGKTIEEEIDRMTFSSQLEANKLRLEVERLEKILDTKDNDINLFKQKNKGNQKGFWDFLYKVFKIT